MVTLLSRKSGPIIQRGTSPSAVRLASSRTALAAAGLSMVLMAGLLSPAFARPAPASFADLVEEVAPQS